MSTLRLWTVGVVLVGTTAWLAAAPQVPAGPAAATASLHQFSGSPIDVDYQSANLRVVLRTLAEIGGVNLVIDPSVDSKATVDLRLTQVPWDQVMDVVLRSSELTYQLDGSVLRVLTRDARTKEQDAERTQRLSSEALPALQTIRLRLSYAKAEDTAKLLRTAQLISSRGTVDFESRTNMLIVRDTPANLQEVENLLTDIDKPEPQVEIEAKIIQTNRNTAQELGVQWGLNGRMTQALGNTTGLAFPNNGTVSGQVAGSSGLQTQGPNDPLATASDQTGTAINLPVSGATTALGLSLGAVNGAFNLDLALSALQSRGKAKILSTPRVTTQNNKEAEITQGFQVPYQTVANNTVTLQFKDAALKLTVTPQITAANTVIMKIELENSAPDFSHAPNGNPSINTQRAVTQVQVDDGLTTVIGGILQTNETSNTDSTPGLSQLPLLGWLFKHTQNDTTSQELLIFITPRIIRG